MRHVLRLTLASVLLLFSMTALALDQKLCTVVTHDGASIVEGCTTYKGLSESDLQSNRARLEAGVVKPAKQVKSTSGAYSMTLTEDVTADGKTVSSPSVTLSNLKLRDVTRVGRAIYKANADVLTEAEKNETKIGKHWGRDAKTGRFVSMKTVAENPATTVTESAKKK